MAAVWVANKVFSLFSLSLVKQIMSSLNNSTLIVGTSKNLFPLPLIVIPEYVWKLPVLRLVSPGKTLNSCCLTF